MVTRHLQQMTTSQSLAPFTIANDCPAENREIFYSIILNLKNNTFKGTKHIQQINIHLNHLAHYIQVKLLDRDQYKKNYTFTLTDEIGTRRSFYNFQNETTLNKLLKTFLGRQQNSQDKTKITATTNSTYEPIRNTTEYLQEKQNKQHQYMIDCELI